MAFRLSELRFAAIGVSAAKGRFVRIADLGARRGEMPLSAPNAKNERAGASIPLGSKTVIRGAAHRRRHRAVHRPKNSQGLQRHIPCERIKIW